MSAAKGLLPLLLGASVALALAPPRAPAERVAGSDEAVQLLRERVLPVLREACFDCHGPTARRAKGGLRIVDRESLLTGGDSGPAVVPGDPDQSLLVEALRYTDDLLEMPPDGPLPADDVAAIERWVELGAPWPREVAAEEIAFAAEDVRFFEDRIRPGLAQHCFPCHGPKVPAPQSGLRMSGRSALLVGGTRGPALVPGDPDQSLLIQAVRRQGPPVPMPPTGPVPTRFAEDLEEWVRRGAPWPDEPDALPLEEGIDVEAGRAWWSFRPVERPAVPTVAHPELVATPLDAFLVARQEAAGITPNGAASRRELIRRATYDLHGLPPTLAEIEAFEADDEPGAWERVVDRLLASPRYGERWARHWLDLVRYAQTNGYERDQEKPFAWQFRNWVIDAFNADMPYDRFLREQLAGDELGDGDAGALIATGFYRLGPWDDEPDDKEQAVFDELDDVVRTISEGMLGVTLACARCHDHKFDPFLQEDYYAMVALLRNVRPYEDPSFSVESSTLRVLNSSPEAAAALEEDRQGEVAATQSELDAVLDLGRQRLIEGRLPELAPEVRAAWGRPEAERSAADRELVAATAALHPSLPEIRRQLSQAEKKAANQLAMRLEDLAEGFAGDVPWALCVRETGTVAPTTYLLRRGLASSPGDAVAPGFPQVLTARDAAPPAFAPAADGASSGRRTELADWIASADNPLTARVLVNRVWRFHFGRGIVPTVNDFGRSGQPPSHPALLDWLASAFVAEDGWSLKALHRRMLTSNAYRMSSQAAREDALAADEANQLFWRQELRRLEAEAIRDSVLMASGELSLERGRRGFFPRLSREALAGSSRPGWGWDLSTDDERRLRTIYTFAKRTQPVPLLEVFDGPNLSLPVGRRSTTTLATQALTLLNSELLNEQAHRFALRVAEEAGDDPAARVTRAFERALARAPSTDELALALSFLAEQERAFAASRSYLTLRPRVPDRLDVDYQRQLSGEDVLFGPRAGWTYVMGRWGNPYNSTLGADERRGPAALRSDVRFKNGLVDARLRISPGTQAVGVLVRARIDDEGEVQGIEVRLEPEAKSVTVLAHGPTESRVGGRFPAPIRTGPWQDLRVQIRGDSLQVQLDGTQVALLDGLPKPSPGALGLRLLGEGVAFERLLVRGPEGTVEVQPDDPGPPDLRALEALCLTLFNLNEFVYVD
ncbi:MAG: DUF1553 domain-containing protein [Planctomycetota bacterium]